MANVSLEASLRTCKIDQGWADRMQSDRFQNPNNLVCPLWNGVDTAGRVVCPDSFYTKNAGCNSAEDRVYVENSLRPQYSEYINLSFSAIAGAIYGDTMGWNEAGEAKMMLRATDQLTGQFGYVNQPGSHAYPGCQYNSQTQYMKAQEQVQRAMTKDPSAKPGLKDAQRAVKDVMGQGSNNIYKGLPAHRMAKGDAQTTGPGMGVVDNRSSHSQHLAHNQPAHDQHEHFQHPQFAGQCPQSQQALNMRQANIQQNGFMMANGLAQGGNYQ
tara:strand:- start:2610 stop:3419 length:810 start_codon:yes stop_codon:yes gene_type:complete